MNELIQILANARQTLSEKPTRVRFRLKVKEATLHELLTSAYIAETRARGQVFCNDDYTNGAINSVVKWLTSESCKPCLMLYGGVGNGKTTMAKAIRTTIATLQDTTRTYVATNRWRMTANENKLTDDILAYPIPVIATAQQLSSMASENKVGFERITNERFLIVDDLGCEPTTVKNYGTEITPITDILYRRYDTLSPTIITTNLQQSEIREKYGVRVADRFNEIFETIGYNNKSYRK